MDHAEGGGTQGLTQRILSGARWATMMQMAGQSISWLSTIFVVRFLQPHDYGLYSMMQAPTELLLMFGMLGLDVAIVRAKALEDAALRGAFGILLLTGALVFGLFFFGAPLIAAYFGEPALESLSRALSVVFLLMPFRVIPNALLDRELQFKARAQIELVTRVVAAIATLTSAIAGAGYWALAAGLLIERLLYVVLVSIRHPWIMMPSLRLGPARPLLAFGGVAALATAVTLTASMGVGIVIAPLLGAAQLGVYSLATQFALLPLAKAMPVLNPLLVSAFARFQSAEEEAARHLEQAVRIAALVLTPVMLGLASLAEPFSLAVFGPRWHGVAMPLAAMCCIMPLRMVTLFLRSVITSLGRAEHYLAAVTVPFVIVFPASWMLAPHGTMAVIAMWVAVEPINLVVTLALARSTLPGFGLGGVARGLRPALSAALPMALAAYLVGNVLLADAHALLRLVAGSAAGAIVYLALLWTFFRPELRKAVSVITGR